MQVNNSVSAPCPRTQGIECFHRNDFLGALACFEQSLSIHPGDRELYNYQARTLERLGRLEESLICIDQCLALEPNNLAELCNRALVLTKLSRRVEALAAFDAVLVVQPNHLAAHIKRAYLLHQLDRRDEALLSAERAVSLAPTNLGALNTRGMIFDDRGRPQEALADFQAILALNPDYSEAITNRGILYARAGQFKEALACYDKSLSINPHQPNAFYNRAVVRMVLGDWIQGLQEFEWRWKLFPHEAARLTRLAPLWSGQEDLVGKTILLHHEQGYGDTLQFCRYAAGVMKQGARVIMAMPASLARIMKTLPGSPQIVSEGDAVPRHDYHCPLMSLPRVFGTTPDNVPASIPYLWADPRDVSHWSAQLGERMRPRVGLVWSGRRYPPINYARDMTLDAVRPLFSLNADFICLHTELSDRERSQLAALSNVTWLGDKLEDFAATAALVENLDLVITVDSAVAHLAGALGKPVWLMNRYASCWRWLLVRTDSPWYPTLRLFRQSTVGDWAGVVHAVLQAGAAFMHEDEVKRSSQTERNLLGMLQEALGQHNRGEFTQAIAAYRRILEKSADQFDTLHYLGVALAQVGRHQEALEPLTHALKIQPDNAVVHNHYGNALAGLSRYGDAIVSYESALACQGALADSHYNCGVAFMELGRHDRALACYTKAIEWDPQYAQAHNNQGNIFAELGHTSDALVAYQRAIDARPLFVDPWINRSHLLRRLHRYEDALMSSEGAITCGPRHPEAHNSHGACLAQMGRYTEALASYQRAIELNPLLVEPRWNLGLIQLTCGNFRQGWALHESRWDVKSLKLPQRFSQKPAWLGVEPVGGKVLLVHAEQGYGDTVQFCRYATVLADRGAQVILSVPDTLKSLLASVPGIHGIVSQQNAAPFDFQTSLMSLPLALGTELVDIPAPARYLHAEPSVIAKWANRLGARSTVARVGLAWSGRPTHANDQNRSIALKDLLPITRADIQWISLQKDIRATDEANLANALHVLRLGEELSDFADTAALIENLDLVITVDTVIAHLAGALGKPVWILLPHVADWRWLLDRTDSPWYPSARLYRQSTRGDWTSVIERVMVQLHREFNDQPVAAKSLNGTGAARRSRARPRKQ